MARRGPSPLLPLLASAALAGLALLPAPAAGAPRAQAPARLPRAAPLSDAAYEALFCDLDALDACLARAAPPSPPPAGGGTP